MIVLITIRFLNDCNFKLHQCNKLNLDPKKKGYIKWRLVVSIIGFECLKDLNFFLTPNNFFHLDPFLTYCSLLINKESSFEYYMYGALNLTKFTNL